MLERRNRRVGEGDYGEEGAVGGVVAEDAGHPVSVEARARGVDAAVGPRPKAAGDVVRRTAGRDDLPVDRGADAGPAECAGAQDVAGDVDPAVGRDDQAVGAFAAGARAPREPAGVVVPRQPRALTPPDQPIKARPRPRRGATSDWERLSNARACRASLRLSFARSSTAVGIELQGLTCLRMRSMRPRAKEAAFRRGKKGPKCRPGEGLQIAARISIAFAGMFGKR